MEKYEDINSAEEGTPEQPQAERERQRHEKRQQALEEFGLECRRRRKRAGLTLAQAAERAEVSASYLGHIETGRRNPPRLETLKKLLRAYGIKRGGIDLIQMADRLSVEEDWDLSEAELQRESQKSVERVYGGLLKTLVEERLDAIEPGLVAIGETLFSEEDIVAVDSSDKIVVIKIATAQATASTLAKLLTCFDQDETFHELAVLHSPDITIAPGLRLVLVAPQFDEEVIRIARYLSVDFKLVRIRALRRIKSGEVILKVEAM